jgi:hypothetical protein
MNRVVRVVWIYLRVGGAQLNASEARPSPLNVLAALTSDREIQTTSDQYQDVSDMLVKVRSRRPCTFAHLNAFSRGDYGNTMVRLLLDGQPMGPPSGFARFGGSVPTPGAFTYIKCGVTRGVHEIRVQLATPNAGNIALLAERSLVVTEARVPAPPD